MVICVVYITLPNNNFWLHSLEEKIDEALTGLKNKKAIKMLRRFPGIVQEIIHLRDSLTKFDMLFLVLLDS
jgi:hypothetical protein